jgi:hypothetical protein
VILISYTSEKSIQVPVYKYTSVVFAYKFAYYIHISLYINFTIIGEEPVLPGSEEAGGERKGVGGQGGEMAQTMYAHVNK